MAARLAAGWCGGPTVAVERWMAICSLPFIHSFLFFSLSFSFPFLPAPDVVMPCATVGRRRVAKRRRCGGQAAGQRGRRPGGAVRPGGAARPGGGAAQPSAGRRGGAAANGAPRGEGRPCDGGGARPYEGGAAFGRALAVPRGHAKAAGGVAVRRRWRTASDALVQVRLSVCADSGGDTTWRGPATMLGAG